MGDYSLNSQLSNSSTAKIVPNSHLGGVQISGVTSTAIPFREQFRCRRLWFFYHDLRALTTSWLPLPVFMGYRIVMFSYTFIWLILHAEARSSDQGELWLTQMTNLSYTLLVISFGSMAILCSVYTVLYYIKWEKLIRYIPKKDFPEARIYKQDNIPWYVKIVWLLYTIAVPSNILVAVGYWTLVYRPCNEDVLMQNNQSVSENGSTATTSMPITTMGMNCALLDAPNFHVHLINVILIFIDLFVSRIPFQLFHFFYPTVFTFLYFLFTIFYWLGGGTDQFGNPYIYSSLDYENSPGRGFGFGIILIFSPILICIILFPLSWLRDIIYRKIPCCYRDIKKNPHREYETDHELSENGANGGGTTL